MAGQNNDFGQSLLLIDASFFPRGIYQCERLGVCELGLRIFLYQYPEIGFVDNLGIDHIRMGDAAPILFGRKAPILFYYFQRNADDL